MAHCLRLTKLNQKMRHTNDISKFYKFSPVSNEKLKSIFNNENFNFYAGCNVYKNSNITTEMYVWVWTQKLEIFDLVEETLIAEEIGIEEIKKIEDDPNYLVVSDIPFD